MTGVRLPRFVFAGVLLYAAVLLLTGLLVQPGYRWTGLTAVAVFLPLWYAIAVVNAWLGVVSAGYPLRDEALVFVAVFGLPAAVAGLGGWADRVAGADGLVGGTARFPVLMAAAVSLFAALLLLVGLLAQPSPAQAAPVQPSPVPAAAGQAAAGWVSGFAAGIGPAALVFGPLWLLVCVGNMVIGVQAAGYSVAEELPVLLLNAAVPIAAAAAGWRLTTRREPTPIA